MIEEIADLENILAVKSRVKSIIVSELKSISERYGEPRRSSLIYNFETGSDETPEIPDYPVTVFVTEAGYFKKVTPLSLRMSGEHKFKEGDSLAFQAETNNNYEMLVFTDAYQVYKTRLSDFEDSKISVLGDFLPSKLEMDPNERPVAIALTKDYNGFMLFAFESGKVAKVPLSAYATKTNRKKLIAAYSDKEKLASALAISEDTEVVLTSSSGRKLLLHTGALMAKTTKNTQGVAVMTQKRGCRVMELCLYKEGMLAKPHRYRAKNLPAAGALPSAEETFGEQISLI